MSVELTFLGTGDVRQTPVFGCDCKACDRARLFENYRRKPCSAQLTVPGENLTLLIDAGLTDLAERYQPGEISAILLTHYHVDHVQGLFHLRWGLGPSIPVYGPGDQTGCADLLKHPGILNFKPAMRAFETLELDSLRVTPIPLAHSKPTFGYLIQQGSRSFAYLTDTVGIPGESMAFLQEIANLSIAIDCSHPPQQEQPRNHNDLNLIYAINEQLKPEHIWLTHISHEMDRWLMDNELPEGIYAARDGLVLQLNGLDAADFG